MDPGARVKERLRYKPVRTNTITQEVTRTKTIWHGRGEDTGLKYMRMRHRGNQLGQRE